MRLRILGVVAALVVAVTGCGKKDAEVPKNPVPMEKPGQGAEPAGKTNPQPAEKPQTLPK